MNTKQKYPMSMIFFHGLLAVLMIATLVVAWMMDDNKDLMPLHKSLGATVFIFGILRILNRMSNMAKLPPSVNHGALHWVEKAVHGLLMLVMLALPFVGWLMSNAPQPSHRWKKFPADSSPAGIGTSWIPRLCGVQAPCRRVMTGLRSALCRRMMACQREVQHEPSASD